MSTDVSKSLTRMSPNRTNLLRRAEDRTAVGGRASRWRRLMSPWSTARTDKPNQSYDRYGWLQIDLLALDRGVQESKRGPSDSCRPAGVASLEGRK
ncbi:MULTISPECIES: hypothetical protein [unclassified Nocardioides]|uniref:hypothetical protein n=1 Tax=unclassified Nocardioides TaxID=2615069 RepID=UPI0006FA7BA5|nr:MULTISPECIES: hypothetical protein [unclassified Nocardioides]KRA31051.1 hypothetical protein ASD81_16285 [Nocardioides sp. Root614]KRA87671.1 hypothetical protein ASD84_16555 [Nocardioides sp. Root682]